MCLKIEFYLRVWASFQHCCYSVAMLCPTLWPHGLQHATISCGLFKLMSTEPVIPSNLLILRQPPLLLPSVFLSIRVFSNELAVHIRWPRYWSFRVSPSNEYSGLISFRMDWFDLLAVQGTLKSLFQHHSMKASVLQYV